MVTAVKDTLSRLSLTEAKSPCIDSMPLQRKHDEIDLLLSVEQPDALTRRNIQVFAEETIHELKIRLCKKEFFTNKHSLVFGNRELLENETIGQVTSK